MAFLKPRSMILTGQQISLSDLAASLAGLDMTQSQEKLDEIAHLSPPLKYSLSSMLASGESTLVLASR